MRLINFKGIRNLEFQFGQETNISGRNGTGKTTLFDGLLWLLFGRDSEGKTDFEIKTLDEGGRAIPQIDHEVETLFIVNGEEYLLRKVYREKWQKKRGSNIPEMTGHENLYFWNEVPMKESEYKVKVAEIMDEKLFRLLTNPLFFNYEMKWEERRRVLFDMSEPVSNEQVLDTIATIQNKESIAWLTNELNRKKTVENMRDELRGKMKAIKEELEVIPIRVDEAYKSIPEEEDFSIYRATIEEQEKVLAECDKSKENILEASKQANRLAMEKQEEKNALQRELSNKRQSLTGDYSSQINSLEVKIRGYHNKIQGHNSDHTSAHLRKNNNLDEITRIENELSNLRAQWKQTNESSFQIQDGATCCPQCHREFEASQVESITTDLRTKFDNNKAATLQRIEKDADNKKARVTQLKQENDDIERNIQILKEAIEIANQEVLQLDNELQALRSSPPQDTPEILALVQRINAVVIPEAEPSNFDVINEKIKAAQDIIRNAEKELAREGIKDQVEKRITELQEREATLSQELSDLEGREFAVEQFNKRRIELLVASVNCRFQFTRFQLFEEQLNGGVSECCHALINTNGSWVPFSSANNAGRINAGVDIINALAGYYKTTAPIFIDNREGVLELIPSQSQIINLRVSEDKTLTLH